MNQDIFSEQRDIYTVTRLNRAARAVLESGFPRTLWVRGEISNLARPGSGHIYFSLKDAHTQVRCAMFKSANRHLCFAPENGQEVIGQAAVSLYEGRGEFQLIVEQLEPAGQGALQLAFERLKQRLSQEGLFDEAKKQPLPAYPTAIGVITSPVGAALQDILQTLKRRYPIADVIVYPAPVQGDGSAQRLAEALEEANRRRDCEILLLARGGGSLEDMWAFNEEIVARAISASAIPVVTGIGHEIDFTIADFVADRRAPTPSVAAELVSPDLAAVQSGMKRLGLRLQQLMQANLGQRQQRVAQLRKRLPAPVRLLRDMAQRLDEQALRMRRSLDNNLALRRARVRRFADLLKRTNPTQRLRMHRERCAALFIRLRNCSGTILQQRQQRLASLRRALQAVSHQATLKRGYAIVTDADRNIVRRADQLQKGDTICAQFIKGKAWSTVRRLEQEEKD